MLVFFTFPLYLFKSRTMTISTLRLPFMSCLVRLPVLAILHELVATALVTSPVNQHHLVAVVCTAAFFFSCDLINQSVQNKSTRIVR